MFALVVEIAREEESGHWELKEDPCSQGPLSSSLEGGRAWTLGTRLQLRSWHRGFFEKCSYEKKKAVG